MLKMKIIGGIFMEIKEVKIEIYIPNEFILKLRNELNKVNAGKKHIEIF